jgi:hypothetical protein
MGGDVEKAIIKAIQEHSASGHGYLVASIAISAAGVFASGIVAIASYHIKYVISKISEDIKRLEGSIVEIFERLGKAERTLAELHGEHRVNHKN